MLDIFHTPPNPQRDIGALLVSTRLPHPKLTFPSKRPDSTHHPHKPHHQTPYPPLPHTLPTCIPFLRRRRRKRISYQHLGLVINTPRLRRIRIIQRVEINNAAGGISAVGVELCIRAQDELTGAVGGVGGEGEDVGCWGGGVEGGG